LQDQVKTPIVAALSDQWQTTNQIAKARGVGRTATLKSLIRVKALGLAKCLSFTTQAGTVNKWALAETLTHPPQSGKVGTGEKAW
jgi:hypothetical protein